MAVKFGSESRENQENVGESEKIRKSIKSPVEMSDAFLAVNISEAVNSNDLGSLELLLEQFNTTMTEFTSSFGNLLHITASIGNVDSFRKIQRAAENLDVNAQNSADGSTALHIASQLGRYEVVEYLLSIADIDDTIKDSSGRTCLDVCTNKQIANLIEYSRSHYKDKTMKALFKAAQKGNASAILSIFNTSIHRNQNLLNINEPDSRGETLLHTAAKSDRPEAAQACLDIGCDPFAKNRKGRIAYEVARKESVRNLLKAAPMIKSQQIQSIGRMEGFLGKWTNYAYRRRWFVLEGSTLSYYQSPSEYPVSCRGSINLEYVRINPHKSDCCRFELLAESTPSMKELKYVLKADTPAEAKRWLIALERTKANSDGGAQVPSVNILHVIGSSKARNEKLAKEEDFIQDSFDLMASHERFFSSSEDLMGFLNNLRGKLQKLEFLFAQKNRRLDAFRKEKDLLEDAVRSLAVENSKWQTWARGQLARLDQLAVDEEIAAPTTEKAQRTAEDMLKSLEQHVANEMLELDISHSQETMESNDSAEEEEFYDAYDEPEAVELTPKTLETPELRDISGVPEQDKSQTTMTNEFGYPLSPRSRIPADSSKMPAISLWNIIKNAIRQDLTRMPIPINFSEPLSMLQRMCEDLTYSDLICRALQATDELERLAYIAAFAATSYAGTDGRVTKPFNPLLGETFELVTDEFRYLSEQVSHHPPIGASFCEARNWTYWNETRVSSRFRGKYLELRPEGLCHLELKAPGTNESTAHYSWNRVNTAVHNVIVGRLYLEHYGKMRVSCHSSSSDVLAAEIEFVPNGWTKSASNRIEGKLLRNEQVEASIRGTWNHQLVLTRNSGETTNLWGKPPLSPETDKMYQFTPFAMILNELTSPMKRSLCPTDSRLRPDQRAMEEGAFDSAAHLKVQLEEKQRRARKAHEADPHSSPKEPRWFSRAIEKDSGQEHWKYLGGYWEARKTGQWSNIPSIYLD